MKSDEFRQVGNKDSKETKLDSFQKKTSLAWKGRLWCDVSIEMESFWKKWILFCGIFPGNQILRSTLIGSLSGCNEW